MMTMEEMLAREEIRQLMALYNTAGDRGVIDEMLGCFTQDAVLEVKGVRSVGRSGIDAYFRAIQESGFLVGGDRRPARHHISTSRVEFHGADAAQAWTYFQLMRAGVAIQTGIYVDRLVRRDGKWVFAERRVKLDHDTLK